MTKSPRFLAAAILLSLSAVSSVSRAAELKVGTAAPNFEAPGLDGKTFELASLKGKSAAVLVFSRGHWCPFCTGHMRQLQKNYAAMRELGAEVVVVFREDAVENLKKSRAQSNAEFVMVSDRNKKRTKDYSPVGYAVYVVDKTGVIRAILPGSKARRASATAILAELKKLSAQ